MGQVLIRPYEHLGEGIDFGEVERMRKDLTKACKEIDAANRVDSPVYTFLTHLLPPELKKLQEAAAERAQAAQGQGEGESGALASLAGMMEAAMSARAKSDFKKARGILAGIKALQGDLVDPFIVQQLALVTYKSKDLAPRAALVQARDILEELSPRRSIDPETLGLWGAIHKRLSEVGESEDERRTALDESVAAYEKGYYLKNDYYNGINYAFLLSTRAAQSSGDEAIADRVQARRVRQRVLGTCQQLLAAGVKGEDKKSQAETEYWVRATIVEALFGLGRRAEAEAAFADAKVMAPESFMAASTEEQLGKLGRLLDASGSPPAGA
jgi:hypothetical protein